MLPAIPAVSSALEGSRQHAMTRCPSSAYCRANSTPRPVSHPVIKTVDITPPRVNPRKRTMTEYSEKKTGIAPGLLFFVDGRVKPGHDEGESDCLNSTRALAARPAMT